MKVDSDFPGQGALKEHSHVFVPAQDFDFQTGCCELKDARIQIELS